jgi:hypothetical protein
MERLKMRKRPTARGTNRRTMLHEVSKVAAPHQGSGGW